MFGFFESVDDVVADLNKKVVKLLDLQKQYLNEAGAYTDHAARLTQRAAQSASDSARASRIGAKLAELIS